jgi:transposase InsO family protein
MTFMGVFMWNRVPMGIKRAGGWFQGTLATVVLVSVMYLMCELYIDDLIIHAQTEEEFCKRLDTVLTKLQERGITVNPDKCVLGVGKLEFVGHTIDKDGLHFTREKIEKVLQIPEPTVGKQLKSFLGVAVWFIEHIEHYSDLARPLHQMLKDYDKKRVLKWTEEGRTAFHALKEAVNNCPMLYFVDDTSPIFVETDASDYGVGGVCYQVVDGKRKYIAFASHGLTGAELNWSVPHKEMYGIVYTLSKMDYLLRDRKFILKTDHKNLISMNTDKNPKVYRWKIAIQDFDALIEYIEGPKNVIADGLSRLLPTSSFPKDNSSRTSSDFDPDSYFEANYKEIDSLELMYNLISEESADSAGYTPGVISFGFASLMPVPAERLCYMKEYECPTEELNVAKEILIPVVHREMIQKCHNCVIGHMGVEKTMTQLHRLGKSWSYMREHVKKYIRECPFCQKMSLLKTPIHTHPFTTAAYGPFQRINIDSIGPISESYEGYCHILVIICCFSRWVELIALKSTEMKPTKKELLKYFGRYGEPGQVLTDGGSQFSNEQIKELIKLVGCEHTVCLAYSKEENSMVERCNKEVMRHLRALVYEINDNSEWEDYLPTAMRIMNGVRNESNQTAPAEIVFGNAVVLDRGLLVDHTEFNDKQLPLSQWASNMLLMQKKFCDRAETLQRQKDSAHMERFPIQRTNWPIGSYVLVEYHSGIIRKGPPSKMLTRLRGPMKVVARNEDDYTLMNLVFNKEEHVHVSLIRQFVYDSNFVDPKDIARRDVISSFEVESIVDHTPKAARTNKSKLDFKVRWRGYTEEHDLWIPFSELRDNPALHKYLWDNGMKQHINRQHRIGEFA